MIRTEFKILPEKVAGKGRRGKKNGSRGT